MLAQRKTNWEEFLKEHEWLLHYSHIAPVELSNKDFEWLKKEIVKAKEKGLKNNNNLVGHIKEEYKILEVSKSFQDFLCGVATTHSNFQSYNSKFKVLSEDKPLYLDTFWVNYMKKYEFNPPHNHDGIYSFVIFVNIPYNLEQEEDYFSEIAIKKSKKEIQTSKFNFLNTDPSGNICTTPLQIDKSFEGKMLMFLSKQLHMVHPFYTSDDYRITVSGNLKIKV
tara:strand:+ start:543 stop:1211 length:669 start_codon:yes stop_codon:yes gene_type:complete